MKEKNSGTVNPGSIRRIIGRYGGQLEGPTVICIAGLHGNEPAGVLALEEVFDQLTGARLPFKGELIGVAGNLNALHEGVRFVEEDLNRMWQPGGIRELISQGDGSQARAYEQQERSELVKAFVESCRKKDSPVYFMDLHTTSAEGSPFITIADTLRNRRFTDNFPVPRILGIEEQLDSTLLNYINELGFISVGFEAGQHESPASIENSAAAIWIMLLNAGCIDSGDIPGIESHITTLRRAARGDCSVYEVRYRHDVNGEEGFSMEPGFTNFQEIKKGQLLAHDLDSEIRSPEGGKIFMPLYQKQGSDGFFIIREINPFWLGISSLLRRARAEKILPYLPGVNTLNGAHRTLAVDLRTAKWHVIELLHLLGYRKKSLSGGTLFVTKREFDNNEPGDYRFSREYPDS